MANELIEDDEQQDKSVSYEKKLDDILNKFMAIIPVIAYAGDLSISKIFLIMLPILTVLVKPFLTKFFSKKKKSTLPDYNSRYIYRYSKLSGYGHNAVYDHLEAYLDTKLKSMNINNCYSDESEYNSYKAKFLLPYNQTMEFKWEGHDLIITKNLSDALSASSDTRSKIPMITISTKADFSVIDKFIAEVQELQRQVQQQERLVKNQIMTFDTDSKTWKKKPIKIRKNFDNTFIKEKDLKMIKKSLKYFKEKESVYDERGTPYKKSFLLHGEPGCGKTSFIYAMARETKRNIYEIPRISDEEKMNGAISLIPDGSLVTSEEIDTIEALKPRSSSDFCGESDIIGPSLYGFIPMGNDASEDEDSEDESEDDLFDSPTETKSGGLMGLIAGGGGNTKIAKKTKQVKKPKKRKVSIGTMKSFYREKLKIYLEILDGYDHFRDCIIIMTTNHLEDIDKAVYRPGRVDHMIEFTPADEYQIKNIFKVFYDLEVEEKDLRKMARRQKTTSYIINTAINPNLDEPEKAINIILGLDEDSNAREFARQKEKADLEKADLEKSNQEKTKE